MHDSTTADDSRGRAVWRFIREILLILILGLVLSVLIRTFVAQVFSIPSGSMENTLQVGDRVVVQKVAGFERGDIIVFSDHANWLSGQPKVERGTVGRALEFVGVLPDTGTNHLIKRLVGMPGDTVECCTTDGKLSVNGVPIDESEYLFTNQQGTVVAPADVPFKVTVPEGTVFVMGDHRNSSRDSRCYLNDISLNGYRGEAAFVPVDNIVGTAWATMFPFEDARFFRTPEAFMDVPEPPTAPDKAVIEPEGVGC